jgi:nicotinamidase-related amidase
VVQEARLFHAFVRSARDSAVLKGGHPLTENYSVLSPEVRLRHDGGILAEPNAALVDELLSVDALIVAGQAASHCVKSSIEDLLRAILARDRALTHRVYILRDCMSAVAVPDPAQPGRFLFDFTEEARAALGRFAEAGMHLVDSSTPLGEWPGFRV